jgi:hypothetical protein
MKETKPVSIFLSFIIFVQILISRILNIILIKIWHSVHIYYVSDSNNILLFYQFFNKFLDDNSFQFVILIIKNSIRFTSNKIKQSRMNLEE